MRGLSWSVLVWDVGGLGIILSLSVWSWEEKSEKIGRWARMIQDGSAEIILTRSHCCYVDEGFERCDHEFSCVRSAG